MPPKWQQPREGGRGRGQRHNEQGQQQLQPMYASQGQGMPYQQHPQQAYMNQQGYYQNPGMQHQYPPYDAAYGTAYDMNAPYGHNQNFGPYHNGGSMYPPMGSHPYNQYGQPQLPFPQQPQYIYNPAIPPQQFYPPLQSPRLPTPSQQQYSQQAPPVVQTPPAGQLPFVPPVNETMSYNIGPRDEHVGSPLESAPPLVVSGVTPSNENIKPPPVAASSAAIASSSPNTGAVAGSPDPAPRTPSVSTGHESPRPPTRSSNTTPLATPSVQDKVTVNNLSLPTSPATIEFTPATTPPLLPVSATPSSPIFLPLAGHREPNFTPPVPWIVESNASQPWPPRSAKGKRRVRVVTSNLTGQKADLDAEIEPSRAVTTSPNQSEVASTSPSVSSSLRLPTTSDDRKPLATSGEPPSGTKSAKTGAQTAVVIPALPKASPKGWTTVPKRSDAANETLPIAKTSQENRTPTVTNPYSTLSTNIDTESDSSKLAASPTSVKSGSEMADAAVDIIKTSSDAGKQEVKPAVPSRSIWTVDNVKSRIVGTNNNSGKNGTATVSGVGATASTANSLAEALRKFNPMLKDSKVTFIKPRGLFNAGNMCYMNSVLQVLVFCPPFYNLLSIYGANAVHSFKSESPLLEAMYMFMQEFSIIDAAKTAEQLKLRLKKAELEQYGKDLNPVSIYDAMKRIPRFVDMQQGQQQDAQEFLGFLLETLNDECVRAMQAPLPNGENSTTANGLGSPVGSELTHAKEIGSANNIEEWQQVGPKQKAALTRSSGTSINSPLTKIFGGNQRSELRVQGQKDSVTVQPYTSLQLDIGDDHVHNIIDALKALTRPEPLRGAFNLQKPDTTVLATKQVYIETVPPILILHLKRFQYDDRNGPQKIWKHVGYPLELEIPKEIFPRQLRKQYDHAGTPKYRLTAVVYHHGPNASGGHYTVDVRRQDGTEWIRLDDTNITRIRDEDVAESGSGGGSGKESPGRTNGRTSDSLENQHRSIGEELEEAEAYGWKQASGPGKKWSGLANGNGTTTPKRKSDKFSVNDKKVAYLLFYQRTT